MILILFVYALIAMIFFALFSAITWNEMSLINLVVVAGLSIMWPATIVLLVIKLNEITKGGVR